MSVSTFLKFFTLLAYTELSGLSTEKEIRKTLIGLLGWNLYENIGSLIDEYFIPSPLKCIAHFCSIRYLVICFRDQTKSPASPHKSSSTPLDYILN
jgi:hypothetical protein